MGEREIYLVLFGLLCFAMLYIFFDHWNITGSFIGVKTSETSVGTWLSNSRNANPNNLNKISSLTIIDNGKLLQEDLNIS